LKFKIISGDVTEDVNAPDDFQEYFESETEQAPVFSCCEDVIKSLETGFAN